MSIGRNHSLDIRLSLNLLNSIFNELNEEYHILRTFDDVVDDIYNTFIKNKGRMYGVQYTGWKLNIISSACIKEDENLNKNNINLYPIYINWYRNIDDKSLATTDIRGIDIDMDENIVMINANLKKGFYAGTLKSLFHHEFIHVKHMYTLKNKNIILNDKNMSDNIENIFNLNDNIFLLIKDILYLFSPTEIQARVNLEYRLVKDMTNKEIYDCITNNDILRSLIELHELFNLYRNVILDSQYLYKQYGLLIDNKSIELYIILNIIGYYLHIKKLDKNDIKKSNILKMLNNNNFTDIDRKNAMEILYKLNKFSKDYFYKLAKTISKVLDEKDYYEYENLRQNEFDKVIEEKMAYRK